MKLHKINKQYGQGSAARRVLRDVDLAIAEGDFAAIVGTSGSGKSSLLNVIGGLDRDFTGEAEVVGQSLRGLSDRALSMLRNRSIGFIFQQFNLLEHLSCGENVALPAVFSKWDKAKVKRRVDDVLERVGLADRRDHLAGRLSGGQKQRVAIARALFHSPTLLLCDEPTGNLDTRTGRAVIELFQQLNDEGITLLIVTHEARVSDAARRVLRIEDGSLSEDPAPQVGSGGSDA
ncbi:MAG: ABC transporter ATP-binding protein [Deltaproteobacteria bacterium]|nr:ABC transporter ATP-binding protein [Deltaproteobacteria bacterium]